MPRIDEVVVTCEHGGNRVPARYARLFAPHRKLLQTHRGYDRGALALARHLAGVLGVDLFASRVTRLLIDLNRSLGHRALFSEITRPLPAEERARILARYYAPYRNAVETALRRKLRGGKVVLHLSVHTFTPILHGRTRTADLGLLYDPRRAAERDFCARWRRALEPGQPALRVRRNHPYRGVADGLTRYLRTRLPQRRYLGVELEVNQRLTRTPRAWRAVMLRLATSLQSALERA